MVRRQTINLQNVGEIKSIRETDAEKMYTNSRTLVQVERSSDLIYRNWASGYYETNLAEVLPALLIRLCSEWNSTAMAKVPKPILKNASVHSVYSIENCRDFPGEDRAQKSFLQVVRGTRVFPHCFFSDASRKFQITSVARSASGKRIMKMSLNRNTGLPFSKF